jgi:GNAT superfamily N-acetyltransferase
VRDDHSRAAIVVARTSSPGYRVVRAEPDHLAALPDIELAAATLLAGHVPESVLQETTPNAVFRAAQREGRLWVALGPRLPVGFALAVLLAERHSHLAEIDVAPPHGRRGIGRALVAAVLAWASASGHRRTTLTTFRSLPWNMPFYASAGFEEISARGWTAELRAIVAAEAESGLAAERRCVMTFEH